MVPVAMASSLGRGCGKLDAPPLRGLQALASVATQALEGMRTSMTPGLSRVHQEAGTPGQVEH